MSDRVRVLVVDDDPDVRHILGVLFTAEGFEPFSAEDGLEAMELADAYQPDVVTLDWEMPALSGIEALPPLRTALPTALIVMFTSNSGSTDRIRAREAGADGLVDKQDGPLPLLTLVKHRFAEVDAMAAPRP